MDISQPAYEPVPKKKKRRSLYCCLGLGVVLLAGGFAYSSFAENRAGDMTVLTILHINDHHGHLPAEILVVNRSLWQTHNLSFPQDAEVKVEYGGLAMIAEVLSREQEDSKVGDIEGPVFRLHAGDALTGTAYYSLFKGEVDAKVMNHICFDAFALGNHEFDEGDANLANFLDNLQNLTGSDCKVAAEVLAANVVPGSTSPLQNKIKPWTIIDRGGVKLGLIGIDTKAKTMESSFPSHGTVLTDETEAAQRSIDELTKEGVKHIAIISHIGYDNDVKLAKALTGVDVIIGADSHSLMGGPTLRDTVFNRRNFVGDYPMVHNAGGIVCIVQAYEHAHLLGRLSLTFDGEGRVRNCKGTPRLPYMGSTFKWELKGNQTPIEGLDYVKINAIVNSLPGFQPVTATDVTYAKVASTIEAYSGEINRRMNLTVVVAEQPLLQTRLPVTGDSFSYKHGCAVAPHVTKSFAQSVQHACFALINAGGVREGLKEGGLNYNDINNVLPFSDTLVEMTLTGHQVKDLLEDVLERVHNGNAGSFPYGSGIRFSVNMSKAKGARSNSIETKCSQVWEELEDSKEYRIVTRAYLALGKDGYDVLKGATNLLHTGLVDLERFLAYLRKIHTNGTLTFMDEDEVSLQGYVNKAGCDHSVLPQTCTEAPEAYEEIPLVV